MQAASFHGRPPARAGTASLPWYDLREIRPATDALWNALAADLRHAGVRGIPDRLNREVPYERQWTSPDFVFGQACGYDVRIAHARRLRVVATPRYAALGCLGSGYSSLVVVNSNSSFRTIEDLRDTRCVINTPTSHSGMNVLRALVAPLHRGGRFFAKVGLSGSHEASLRMIRRGEVDVAAIDAVTYALLARHRPGDLAGGRVLHRTRQVPAPPYVTAAATPLATITRMREALAGTFHRPSLAAVRADLLISGIEFLPDDAYRPIETLETMALNHSYLEIPNDVLREAAAG